MSLKINYNVSAMIANNSLKLNDNKLTTSLGRLSSGYKINSAKDDAAGLAISRRMNAQLKGLRAASQDAKDGVSVVEIADGALAEVHDILQRMNELAVKSANGTLMDGDRDAIQKEIAQLGEEIDRIGQTTEYNSQRLFTGEFDLKGYTNQLEIKVDSYSDAMMYGKYDLKIEAAPMIFNEDKDGNITINRFNGSTENKTVVTRPDSNKEEYEISGDMYHLNFKGDNGDAFTLDISGYNIREFSSVMEGKDVVPSSSVAGAPVVDPLDPNVRTITTTNTYTPPMGVSVTRDETVVETQKFIDGDWVTQSTKTTTTYADVSKGLEKVVVSEGDVKTYTYTYTPTAEIDVEMDLTGYGAMTFQIGANESQTLDIRFEKLSMESLGFKYQDSDQTKDMCLNVGTQDGATKAIDQITAAINQISSMRSRLGAMQNRLEHTESNLATSDENMTAAYSRIMDTDMAEEMSNYSNLQIVSQAATSILAQANERPSQMLQLLQ